MSTTPTRVEYMDYDTTGKLNQCTGDRCIVILDGRRSLSGLIDDAHECNGIRRPSYPAFRIFKGDRALTDVIRSF